MKQLISWAQKNPKKAQTWGAIALFLVVDMCVMWPLFAGGHTVFGDIDIGFWTDNYLKRMATPWNDLWSSPNFFNMPRLLVMAPLWGLANALQMSGQGLFVLLVLACFLTAQLGTFCLMRHVLRRHDPDLPAWGVAACAIGSGLIYGLNPWFLIRIQHIYLLIGYALLPIILLCAMRATPLCDLKKPMSSISFGWLLAGAFAWVLAAGAVHYVLFAGLLVWCWGLHRAALLWSEYGHKVATRLLIRLGIMTGLTLFGLMYFLLPTLSASVLTGGVAPANVNAIESLSMFSRHSQWHHVLLGSSYWWPMFELNSLPKSYFFGGFFILISTGVGALLQLQKRLVRFLILWVTLCVVFAMGTAGLLRPVLAWLVFDAPGAGAWGFLFRDPNKVVGLSLFGISMLWGLSAGAIGNWFAARQQLRKKEQIALHALWGDHHAGRNWWAVPAWFFGVGSVVAYTLWVTPFVLQFMNQKYAPVKVPLEYAQLNSHLKNTPGRVVHLPRYETEQTPEADVGEVSWAQNHPSSGIDVQSTRPKSLTTTEGVTPQMGHLLAYLTEVLQHGKSPHVAGILASLGASSVAYHSDINGFDGAHQTASRTLKQQTGASEVTQLGFFDILQMPSESPISGFARSVTSTEGLTTLTSLPHLRGYQSENTAVFTTESGAKPADETDVLLTRFAADTVLSAVPERHKVNLFDATNEADGFTKWGKTRTTTGDWRWHLRHLNVTNWAWDGDHGAGAVYSYAPRRLNLPTGADPMNMGKTIISTTDFADRQTDFFTAHDPERLEVQFAPSNAYDALPFIRGEIARGDTKFWKVVTSEFIDIEPLNAYSFGLTMSGHRVNKLHGKVKYFDASGNELTVSYVSAPQRVESFDFVRFSGTFITPPETAKMQLQLWSHQRPDEKLFWWVHDLQVVDLADFVTPNVLTTQHTVADAGAHEIYIRSWHGTAAGAVKVRIDGNEWTTNQATPNIHRWGWVRLGTADLEFGVNAVEVENMGGFNAVSQIAIVPVIEHESATRKAEKVHEQTRQLTILEAENDMVKSGNIQSKLSDIRLSGGRGVRLRNGHLAGAFDVLEAGQYQIEIRTETGKNDVVDKEITLRAHDEMGHKIAEKQVVLSAENTATKYVSTGLWDLPQGKIQLVADVKSTRQNRMETADLHPFEYDAEWRERDVYLDTLGDTERNIDCCDCVDLGDGFLRVQHSPNEPEARLGITSGCSCWWVITASNVTPVEAEKEHWISFDARAQFARKNHYKIIFLDKEKVFLDYHILKDTPSTETYDWTHIERIITPPEHTAFVQFQVWSRQNRFTASQMNIKNLDFVPLSDLTLVDAISITEGEKQLWNSDEAIPSGQFRSVGLHSYEVVVPPSDKQQVIRLSESASPLWQMKNADSVRMKQNPHMGNMSAWRVPAQMTESRYKIGLRVVPHWRTGWIISGLTWFLSGAIWWLLRPRKRKHQPQKPSVTPPTPPTT